MQGLIYHFVTETTYLMSRFARNQGASWDTVTVGVGLRQVRLRLQCCFVMKKAQSEVYLSMIPRAERVDKPRDVRTPSSRENAAFTV